MKLRMRTKFLLSMLLISAGLTWTSLLLVRRTVQAQVKKSIFADLHIFDLWKLSDRPAILIGIDVLRHFHDVTLDFGRNQILYARR